MVRAIQISFPIRLAVAVRDGDYCTRCSVSILSGPSSIHHRHARGMGGSTDPRINDMRNLVQVCGSGTTGCHGLIHAHPVKARENGWTLSSLDDLDTPIRTLFGSRVTLTDTGARTDWWPFDLYVDPPPVTPP